jgi:uncharacterized cupin superfamily protein
MGAGKRPSTRIATAASVPEGGVEVTLDGGSVPHAGPGDVADTPGGGCGCWRNPGPVRESRAISEPD